MFCFFLFPFSSQLFVKSCTFSRLFIKSRPKNFWAILRIAVFALPYFGATLTKVPLWHKRRHKNFWAILRIAIPMLVPLPTLMLRNFQFSIPREWVL
jgi:hypothetical protein